MAHPYKDQANSSHKTKTGNMGKESNLVLPIMRAVGENSGKKLYSSSSASMQHKDQASADGMKRGGHVGKKRHSKPKSKTIVIAAPEAPVTPPSPLPPVAAAGTGSSPVPAPMPPMKSGGRTHSDVAEDKALIKKMVKPAARLASGGRAYPLTAGSESGKGRLQKAHSQARKS